MFGTRHRLHKTIKSEQGAIDLSSIMVGIVVIGLIGGVIAATVFSVIPWAQDKAAQQQLDSVAVAQAAYKAKASDPATAQAEGFIANSYADSANLASQGLLLEGDSYCTIPRDGGYIAFSQSASGKIFTISDQNTSPAEYNVSPEDAELPGCEFLAEAPLIDENPTLTALTLKCDTTMTGSLAIRGKLNGELKVEGTDGTQISETYNNEYSKGDLTFQAGVEYKVTFNGTYTNFGAYPLSSCYRSLDHWGTETGVINAANGMYYAHNLTYVSPFLPSTVTDISGFFEAATAFNHPNVSKWDTKNVEEMQGAFRSAYAFNQPLNRWDVSKVTNMNQLFYGALSFNQPLTNWNVSKVTDMGQLFSAAESFNQPLNNWNVENVKDMTEMFASTSYNHPLDKWDVSNVENFSHIFAYNKEFKQPLSHWKLTSAKNISGMFKSSNYNQPLNDWDVSKVTNMSNLFSNSPYNHPLDKWDTSNVTNMEGMFSWAKEFNHPIGHWDVSKVTDMSFMLAYTKEFNQPLNDWKVDNVTNMRAMFDRTEKFNQPLNKWNVSKATDVAHMFNSAESFDQDLSSWTFNVTPLHDYFQTAFKNPAYQPPQLRK